jgi:hypothetical protein
LGRKSHDARTKNGGTDASITNHAFIATDSEQYMDQGQDSAPARKNPGQLKNPRPPRKMPVKQGMPTPVSASAPAAAPTPSPASTRGFAPALVPVLKLVSASDPKPDHVVAEKARFSRYNWDKHRWHKPLPHVNLQVSHILPDPQVIKEKEQRGELDSYGRMRITGNFYVVAPPGAGGQHCCGGEPGSCCGVGALKTLSEIGVLTY